MLGTNNDMDSSVKQITSSCTTDNAGAIAAEEWERFKIGHEVESTEDNSCTFDAYIEN